MFISELSIRRPVTATMLSTLLVVFGIIGLERLGIDLFPNVEFPMVTVTTIWENARPEEVDNNVTDELEDAIGEVSAIKHIASISMEGTSFVVVSFELGRNVDIASQEVQEKVSGKLGELPFKAEKPVLDRIDVNARPVVWFCLYGRYPIEELTRYAKDVVRPLFQKLKGIGEVPLRGKRDLEVRIWLNRDKLTAYNITVDEVIAAVKKRHIEVPGGKVESARKEFLVRTMGEFTTPESFARMIIDYRKGTAITLKEVGYVESGREDNTSIARFTDEKGKRYKGVGIGVTPRSGENKVAVARAAKAQVQEIRDQLPPGMHFVLTSDRSEFIRNSIDEVMFHLIIGGFMAALSIYIFLQSFSTTLIAALAVPTSIIATFAVMYFFDFTLNNMTLLGLTMAVGLVIDDAIVMVENIFRHRRMGKSALAAALDGSREIGFAVISITFALMGVFLPVAFMGGIVGKFFLEFALTVASAIALSAFIALTLIPMLSSRFLRINENAFRALHVFDKLMDKITLYYRRLIGMCLRNKGPVVLLALACFLCGTWILSVIGFNFFRQEDEGSFLVRLETPLEYSLEKTDGIVSNVESIIKEISGVRSFFSITGYSGQGDKPQSDKAIVFVNLVPKKDRDRHQEEIMKELRRKLSSIPDLQTMVSFESILGSSARDSDLQYTIRGPDIEVLDRVSDEMLDRLGKIPGFVDLDRDLELGKPEIQVEINRRLCADLGISVESIARTIGALVGGEDVVEFKKDGKSYDVRLRLVEQERIRPQDLERLWVRTDRGKLVELNNVVTLKHGFGPSVINRLDRQRSVSIFTDLEGKALGDAIPEVERIAAEILPAGYSGIFMGKAEAFQETVYYIGIAFLLAVILTYMVIASQFESFVHPITIMVSIPLSFVGAFGLLYITGNSFDLFAMIGLVLLVGLVTKNSILLIEFANQKKKQGLPVDQALIEAGAIRLRPILMTAISTVAGILPVALGIGIGSETRQPMALVVAGGILSSTLLTLIVIPVVYAYLDQFANLSIFTFLKRKVFAE